MLFIRFAMQGYAGPAAPCYQVPYKGGKRETEPHDKLV